jgi:hypothetical protein
MKNKEEWYEIHDIDKFVESTRVLIYDAFGKKESEIKTLVTEVKDLETHEQLEIDSILSQQEGLLIVKSLARKKNKKYTINHAIYSMIIESFNQRLVDNLLSNLTNKGLIESAFDSETNDFIFWIPDEKNDQKSETD